MNNQNTPQRPIFKIGTTRSVEDAPTSGLNAEAVRQRLKVNFPEMAHAIIHETTLEGGTPLVE